MAAPSNAEPSKAAITRLSKDLLRLQRSPNPQIAVRPSASSLLEWHFVLHSLPKDTPFGEGCYHGKIMFPSDYPLSPPGLMMLTPSGRMEVGRRLCLSMTDYHPENWNPAWSTETILIGLLSFFIAEKETGYGCIVRSEEVRRQLAAESLAFNLQNPEFVELFPEFVGDGEPSESLPGDSPSRDARPPSAVLSGGGGAAMSVPTGPSGGMRDPLLQVEAPRGLSPENRPSSPAPAPASVVPWLATEAGDADAGMEVPQGPQGEVVAQSRRPGGQEEHEGTPECWICRDDTGEPLIHPCRCRGTMSGVHASCVNAWVAHSRVRTVDAEAPRCSVCHEPYVGEEQRPGVTGFARHMCSSLAQSGVRIIVYAALALLFQAATTPKCKMSIWFRLPILTVCIAVWLAKVTLLTVSFPPGFGQPRYRFLNYFYTTEAEVLSRSAAEISAGSMCIGFWTVVRLVDWPFGLAFLLCALAPVIKILMVYPAVNRPPPMLRLVMSVGIVIGSIIIAPFAIIYAAGRHVYRNPKRVFTPFGATWHIVVSIAVFPLCLVCASNLPVLLTLAVHEIYLLIALTDLLVTKRWEWNQGAAWGFACQFGTLATYVANIMCVFPKGIGGKTYSSAIVCGASLLWLLTLLAVSVLVNWRLIMYYYNVWQSRHGTFALRETQGGSNAGGEVGPVGGEQGQQETVDAV